ncbi:MAG TPA: dolichyl-phosphate beta-glucosyltransferase [Blastocatellia bacterium]|nr:dolichyl-phosphate beta-glucosyltransferase [Blastocatellia bacterium]
MAPLVSIVIPAYNEESRIGPTLDEVLRFLSAQPYASEVVIVDDGSTDRTPEIVAGEIGRYAAAGCELRVFTNKPNRGKGYSVRRGITESRGVVALFTDADLSSPIAESSKLINPITEGQVDVAFGSRAIDRSLIGVHQPLLREYGGRVFNLIVKAITWLPYNDTQCGFKAFRRELALPVFQLQRIERFGFDPEILYIARKLGLRLAEVPVIWNNSEGTKVSFLRDSVKMVVDLFRIRLNDITGRYRQTPPPPSISDNAVVRSAKRP